MSRTFKVAFGVIVAAQLALLLAFIGVKEYALNTGDTVVLQTVPVDPPVPVAGRFCGAALQDFHLASAPGKSAHG